ncbi:hypothetical protein AAX26_02051 [Aliarcobacter thereius]|uniref:tetratricopeptide repeat protein n=1 Tax=Aliarcobacter thereius TaxID=544718 RepID=UPI000829021E|nr:tetratricopeptide repeat protein [Aliarcobacter thereius]OCL85301.1 hypothetical protein AAX26_02051 [Aliarcobacter thereius]
MRKIFLLIAILFKISFAEDFSVDVTNDGLEDRITFLYNFSDDNYLLIIQKQDKNGNFNTILNKKYFIQTKPYKDYIDRYTSNFASFEINNFNTIQTIETPFTINYKNRNSLIFNLRVDGLGNYYKLYFEYDKESDKFNLDRTYFLSFSEYKEHPLRAVYLIQNDKLRNITLDNFNIAEIHKYLYDSSFSELKAKKIKSKEIVERYNEVLKNPKENAEYLLDCLGDDRDEDCGVETIYFFEDDIEFSNNIALFLIEAGYYKETIPILEQIIEKEPNRIVAYLNLADAYLQNSKEYKEDINYITAVEYYKEKAKENYEKYVKLMKQDNKDKRIPKRVLEFLENE